MPVWERMYWASNARSSSAAFWLLSSTENSQDPKKASVTEKIAGLS